MTLKSTWHHFLDKHAKGLSHKTYLSTWHTEVAGEASRQVEKVELCSGVCLENIAEAPTYEELIALDRHALLQVFLEATEHHPQQVVLIERVKSAFDFGHTPHSAIPLPENLAQAGNYLFDDCVCVIKHESSGTDVVCDLEVERTVEFHGNMSVEKLATVLQADEDSKMDFATRGIDCKYLARSFAEDGLQALAHHGHHHHS